MTNEQPEKPANPLDTDSVRVLRLKYKKRLPDGRRVTELRHGGPGGVQWGPDPAHPMWVIVVIPLGTDSIGRPRANIVRIPLTSIDEDELMGAAEQKVQPVRSIIHP